MVWSRRAGRAARAEPTLIVVRNLAFDSASNADGVEPPFPTDESGVAMASYQVCMRGVRSASPNSIALHGHRP